MPLKFEGDLTSKKYEETHIFRVKEGGKWVRLMKGHQNRRAPNITFVHKINSILFRFSFENGL